jgi:hypothetical protein
VVTLLRSTLTAALVLASSAALAQGAVTLYGGVRSGGDFTDQNANDASVNLKSGAAAALSYDWILDDGRQAQVFYSFQRSALPGSVANQPGDIAVNVSYLHIGGRVFFDGTQSTSGSYLVGGLGITHFSPSLDGLSSEVRPSMNVGLGHQWLLSRQLALRTELRGYLTLVNSSGGFFCSGGACIVKIRGDTLLQVEGLLGLSYAF